MTVPEAMAYLKIGRSAAYEFARQHGVRIGGRIVRIPKEKIAGR